MTEQEENENSGPPDAWGIFHRWDEPVDGIEGHMFGPFPSYDLAMYVKEHGECECPTTLIPMRFPAGIKMMASVDTPTLLAGMVALQEEEAKALVN